MNRIPKIPLLLLSALSLITAPVLACPYCTVERATLAEEMDGSDVVVLAKLVEPTGDQGPGGVIDPETGKAKFHVEKVLLGEKLLNGADQMEAVFFGEPIQGQTYLIRGLGAEELDWTIPIPVSETAAKYVQEIRTLPEKGPERARYFYDYLEHEDPLLAQDSYDEFARTPYADVVAISDKIQRDQLWQWIEDPQVSPSRRSLYFVMLGIVGDDEDVAKLEQMMLADGRVLKATAEASAAMSLGLGGGITLPILPEMVAMQQRQKQLGFNAMVGCYLKLTGSEGLDRLDEEFLTDPSEDPTKVYGVLLALRFLAEETDEVSMDRLKESMRLVLEKPDFAEQAIRDLSRWQDWTVLDRLVTMFTEADPKTYVKEPIVAYLDQAAQQQGDVGQRATDALAKIEEMEPETVKRARSLMSFGFLGFARPGSRPADQAPPLNSPRDAQNSEELDKPESVEQLAESSPAVEDTIEETADTELVVAEPTEPATTEPEPETETTDDQTPADTQVAQDELAPSESEPAEASEPVVSEPVTSEAEVATLEEVPSPMLVMGIPLVAAAVMIGLVWLVLRGGN
ncbi:hypothetical protein NG895_25265 [Aeoliella sp. ICT_H6.2]|uniref:HEAT repeat domain-containing protein n=1 Tax=Aeoliella straminimaris TaxID=2954799 RepID=A0A9X2FFD8_9BACT|nr:hypothetical protein [Aeoliella straminimaris]MCO6047223.1 hypothetical protein [Aeoliella straminimaris]